jgi:hypothetical protein
MSNMVRMGWRGALEIADCHSVNGVPEADWQALVSANPTEVDTPRGLTAGDSRRLASQSPDAERMSLQVKLDRLGQTLPLRVANHVSIDRWTGGAAEGLLYSVLEPSGVAWQPLRMRLDVPRAGGPRRHPGDGDEADHRAMALLLLLLRDLAEGWVTLGFGGTRGQGQVSVEQVRFTGRALPAPWSALSSTTLTDVLATPPRAVRDAMAHWATAFPLLPGRLTQ